MSVTRRIAFGASAAWFGRGVNILLGLVLLPVLFRHLPAEELGLWLLLGQSWATMGILDLGFGVTFTRRIALAKGRSGSDPDTPLTPEVQREIADLVACGRRIYRIMAGAVFLLATTSGFLYLQTLDLHHVSRITVWIAWVVLCADNAFGIWSTVWNCLLQGIGYVGWDSIIASFISTTAISLQIIAVLAGGRLVTLAVIATLGALGQRTLLRRLARWRRPELFALRGRWNPAVLRGLPELALRAWLTAVGTVLVFNTDNFLIASAKGAADIPSYRACYLIVLNMQMLAVTFSGASSVFISQLWQAGEMAAVQRVVRRNIRLGLLIILCGSAWMLSVGGKLFDVWLGPGRFVGYPTLLAFVVMFTFDVHSYIISGSSRATEDEAFAGWSIAAGVLKLLFAWLLLQRFQLAGIAIGTFVAQLVTIHWYMTYRGLGQLKMSVGHHFTRVLAPCAVAFAIVFTGAQLVELSLSLHGELAQVIATGTFAVLAFAAACWTIALEPAERATLIRRFLNQATVVRATNP